MLRVRGPGCDPLRVRACERRRRGACSNSASSGVRVPSGFKVCECVLYEYLQCVWLAWKAMRTAWGGCGVRRE